MGCEKPNSAMAGFLLEAADLKETLKEKPIRQHSATERDEDTDECQAKPVGILSEDLDLKVVTLTEKPIRQDSDKDTDEEAVKEAKPVGLLSEDVDLKVVTLKEKPIRQDSAKDTDEEAVKDGLLSDQKETKDKPISAIETTDGQIQANPKQTTKEKLISANTNDEEIQAELADQKTKEEKPIQRLFDILFCKRPRSIRKYDFSGLGQIEQADINTDTAGVFSDADSNMAGTFSDADSIGGQKFVNLEDTEQMVEIDGDLKQDVCRSTKDQENLDHENLGSGILVRQQERKQEPIGWQQRPYGLDGTSDDQIKPERSCHHMIVYDLQDTQNLGPMGESLSTDQKLNMSLDDVLKHSNKTPFKHHKGRSKHFSYHTPSKIVKHPPAGGPFISPKIKAESGCAYARMSPTLKVTELFRRTVSPVLGLNPSNIMPQVGLSRSIENSKDSISEGLTKSKRKYDSMLCDAPPEWEIIKAMHSDQPSKKTKRNLTFEENLVGTEISEAAEKKKEEMGADGLVSAEDCGGQCSEKTEEVITLEKQVRTTTFFESGESLANAVKETGIRITFFGEVGDDRVTLKFVGTVTAVLSAMASLWT